MRGDFHRLVRLGKLKVGTRLHHLARGRPELNVEATVEANGIVLNGEFFTTPSAAARSVTGQPTDGYLFWRLPSGKQLSDLRNP
jgi:hypothetical protein